MEEFKKKSLRTFEMGCRLQLKLDEALTRRLLCSARVCPGSASTTRTAMHRRSHRLFPHLQTLGPVNMGCHVEPVKYSIPVLYTKS
jgi:hypothetical protein